MDPRTFFEALDAMEPVTFLVLLIATVVVVLAGFAATGRRRLRTAALAERFGAEYGRVVDSTRSRRRAETALEARADRRRSYDVKRLDDDQRTGFQERWDKLQVGFVDGPAFAAEAAVELIMELAVARGYSNDGLEPCLDDVSVDHPELVAPLRRARSEAARWSTTEHHRQTFVHTRTLFERLIAQGATSETALAPETSETSEASEADDSTADTDDSGDEATDAEGQSARPDDEPAEQSPQPVTSS